MKRESTATPDVCLALLAVVLAVAAVGTAEPARDQEAEPRAAKPASPDQPQWETIWQRYPALERENRTASAGLDGWLRSLEPEAFARRYGELGPQTQTDDKARRLRAIRAVATLRELAGLPYLVRATEADLPDVRLWAFQGLAAWVYDEYHESGRKVPQALKPLLPFFVTALVETAKQDEPNVRSYCFQAIGCLVGPEWLGLLKEAAPSRHPAVTHWANWCVEEITKRADSERAKQ